MTPGRCDRCDFRTPLTSECHRYPPQVTGEGRYAASHWPSVKPDDWCGEYTPDLATRQEIGKTLPKRI